LRGYADDMTLQDWLFKHIFPIEDKMVAHEIYVGTRLALCEMIKSGTTLFCDMYPFGDKVAKAAEEAGIRANVSRALTGMETGDFTHDTRMKEAQELIDQYKNHSTITPDVSVHAVYTSSPEYLRACAEFSQENHANMHIHISETKRENDDCIAQYGKTPTKFLHASGYFQTPTYAAHCVYLTEEDAQIFKNYNVTICHNPTSNLKLASGVAPIPKYRGMGINVALGTDGASSNNNLSMMNEIRMAALIHKGVSGDPTAINAHDSLYMATRSGAKAIGREGDLGQIKPGYKADFVVIDTNSPNLFPLYSIESAIVYSATSHDVKSVAVAGEFLMYNRELKTLDFEKIKHETKECTERLFM
jgi:5-methylthioadenosine/S-adenosylhomocysteine deaminase